MQKLFGVLFTAAACGTLLLITTSAASAANDETLVRLINAYRAAPGMCEGKQAQPAASLAPHPALASLPIASGTVLQSELDKAGYAAEQAEGIYVSGTPDAASVMSAIRQSQCRALLSSKFTSVGIARRGDDWLIVLARPVPALQLPAWPVAGKIILDKVNAARATARSCGDQRFAAAPPLAWNERLGEAALAHARDMAANRYFSHQGKDGSQPGDRARRHDYDWRRIGENIASGLRSPEDAVAGWLTSPGHCANIMDPGYAEMGAAYAITPDGRRAYWTEEFGAPRHPDAR